MVGDELVVSRTAPGRGAWLCPGSERCGRDAARQRAFARALRRPVPTATVDAAVAEVGAIGAGSDHGSELSGSAGGEKVSRDPTGDD